MRLKDMALFLVILLAVSVPAQTPTPQSPSPCLDADLRASVAESLLAAERLKTEACQLLLDLLKKESARQKEQITEVEQKLSAGRENFAILAASNERVQQKNVGLEGSLAERTAERDKALTRIKRANGRLWCEVFSICT